MISFRTVDGNNFNCVDDAIAHETQRFESSQARMRRGVGSEMINQSLRENLKQLKHFKQHGVWIPASQLGCRETAECR